MTYRVYYRTSDMPAGDEVFCLEGDTIPAGPSGTVRIIKVQARTVGSCLADLLDCTDDALRDAVAWIGATRRARLTAALNRAPRPSLRRGTGVDPRHV